MLKALTLFFNLLFMVWLIYRPMGKYWRPSASFKYREWQKLVLRCRLTTALIVANIVLFIFTTDRFGIIDNAVLERWAYSWDLFRNNPVHSLILSPFLHYNILHLNLNLILLVLFVGPLEYMMGTTLAALTFAVAATFSNPLTSFFTHFVFPGSWTQSFDPIDLDVGASLGAYGAGGALVPFLRRGKLLFICLFLGGVAQGLFSGGLIGLDHSIAAMLGLALGLLRVRFGD